MFKTFRKLLENYRFTMDHGYNCIVLDKGERLLYSLKRLNRGEIEVTCNDTVHIVKFKDKNFLSKIEKIIGRKLNMKDPSLREFLSHLPINRVAP